VTTPDNQTTIDNSNPAADLVALEGLVLNYIDKIEKHQEILRSKKEMLESNLENDPNYQEAAKQAKELSKKKQEEKARIIRQPEVEKIYADVKDGQGQLRTMRDTLSNHLQNYGKLSGTNQLEDEEGQVREIVYTAKVVKRSNKNRT
jgi:hypothetical protein